MFDKGELEEIRELLARILVSSQATEATQKNIETTVKSIDATEKLILAALSNPPATAIGNLFGEPTAPKDSVVVKQP